MPNRGPTIGQPLSVRELEVATLIAEGATNRDVAAALMLSPKTVGAHLQRIYRKLGIHRRSRLAYLIGSEHRLQPLAAAKSTRASPPAAEADGNLR